MAARFFPVPLLDLGCELAACSICCALIIDDTEGANRQQHAGWHDALELEPADDYTACATCGAPATHSYGPACDRHVLAGDPTVGPCPHCDEASVVDEDGYCVHCGADRAALELEGAD
jgi:hypothetical protein